MRDTGADYGIGEFLQAASFFFSTVISLQVSQETNWVLSFVYTDVLLTVIHFCNCNFIREMYC